ncbi:serine/threonine-protein kinase RIO1-like [Paramacrobiotus metropolitanus]|uniref:serine/threonine-protein kinase RIO1-like n=1 Tax=Paramacrobiotus metropolitanus TaxID=2943436 RepID=UPI00244625B0|nr:serine/threonine-protein kinase RIO1-like [Paramacrobiotus metropolitanus]
MASVAVEQGRRQHFRNSEADLPHLRSASDNSDESDEDDEVEYDDNGLPVDYSRGDRAAGTGKSIRDAGLISGKTYQPRSLVRFSHHLDLEGYYQGPKLSGNALNSFEANLRKTESERIRVKDKMDRATVEQVLDPKTRMILYKLLNKQIVAGIDGCISTGKEANVYHAENNDGRNLAIKIYKTSILTFKDRDKYVSGEFRWRHGYSRHNPRKMVRTWAEKEMRNLLRLRQGGISVPEPVILRGHVLVMEFIGEDGWPSPKLKDVDLSDSKAKELYASCVLMMRQMYQDCKLVHADLSEFNILYHKGQLCIIDVSQSVEHDHPHSLEFLRIDCTNMTNFFQKLGVPTLTVRELFEYVTDAKKISKQTEVAQRDALLAHAAARGNDLTEEEQVAEEVFKRAFIPQRLEDVIDFERDVRKLKEGQHDDLLYKTLAPVETANVSASDVQDVSDTSESEEEDNSEHDAENKPSGSGPNPLYQRSRDESPNTKKERKQAVKDQQREKRKQKVPKHVKKRQEKVAKQGHAGKK